MRGIDGRCVAAGLTVLCAVFGEFGSSSVGAGAASAQLTFTEIAREFTDGLGFLTPEVRPALSDNGTVVFAGRNGPGDERVFSGNGMAPIVSIDPSTAGLSDVSSLQVIDTGAVALVAETGMGINRARGVYITDIAGSGFSTIYEGMLMSTMTPPVNRNVAVSPNGTLAFSTIVNGDGAIYRGPIAGPVSVLREGTGTFFNTKRLDVNDAGQVPIQMEYFDPTRGLARGILIFDSPAQATSDIVTAVEKQSIGTQPEPAINSAGQVAFVLNNNATATFYDPPDDASGAVVEVINFTPGVYVATPTAFGQPSSVTQLVDASSGFTNYQDVDINDEGVVVFEASHPTGFGIFTGPDVVADKIIQVGDVMGALLFSFVTLGELNNAGEVSIITSDFNTTDRQVWRIGGLSLPDADGDGIPDASDACPAEPEDFDGFEDEDGCPEPGPFPPGCEDVDGTGDWTFNDVREVWIRLGARAGRPRYLAAADLNNSGRITFRDLIIAFDRLRTCP